MSIKRYTSNKTTSISNAFMSNLRTRQTGSNYGASDIIEIFSIYAQANSSSSELKRALLEFPISSISSDRSSGKIPSSGSVDFYLKMFNAPHGETLPRQFNLIVSPVSRSWQAGVGLDHENGSDITRNGEGANWINASSASVWTTAGGDYLNTLTSSQFFDEGLEDLEINITPLVESWLAGTIPNYGVGVALSSSHENTNRSFYTKRFLARTSEFFFSRPIIEARWNSSTTDDRDKFFTTSPLLSTTDNTHTVYLYNYVGGQLKNIPGISSGSIYLQVYTSASEGTLVNTIPSPVTGGWVSTGIYSASFELNTTKSVVYDRWFSGSIVYHTGSINPLAYDSLDHYLETRGYVTSITNLKPSYSNKETARIRLFIRPRDWSPNLVSIASADIQGTIVENSFFKVMRINDNHTIVDYGTSSTSHTKLSYDGKGMWFDCDMSMFEPSYTYAFRFVFLEDGIYAEQPEIFRFRVD